MTLTEIKFLHAYNSWANNHIFETLAPVPEEKYKRDMKSSHGGLHGTLVHIVGAEKLWLERFAGNAQPMLKSDSVPSLAELRSLWEKTGFDMARWLGAMSDRKLQETFTMKTLKGDTYTHVFWHAFQHMVNHSSYHRGQIITMLRQLDEKPVTTDLIRFYRETAKK
jgi:uncharacterized damage-inducible protein DinB